MLLQELGHIVFQPEETEMTLSFLDAYWPDAIVVNQYLGETTAPELCDQITELFGELPPTLIHSSAPEHRFYALRFKKASFLKSPFSPDDLQSALMQMNPAKISLTG